MLICSRCRKKNPDGQSQCKRCKSYLGVDEVRAFVQQLVSEPSGDKDGVQRILDFVQTKRFHSNSLRGAKGGFTGSNTAEGFAAWVLLETAIERQELE